MMRDPIARRMGTASETGNLKCETGNLKFSPYCSTMQLFKFQVSTLRFDPKEGHGVGFGATPAATGFAGKLDF